MYNSPKSIVNIGEIMYVDILFAENLIINYSILTATSRFSKLKTTRLKLILGSGIGALYVMVVFFPSLRLLLNLSIKIAVSALMIVIAFTPEGFKEFFKAIGIFYIICFAFGGGAFAIFYISGRGTVLNGAFFIKDFPASILFVAFAICYLLLVYCWDYIQSRVLKGGLIYNIVIGINNKYIETSAILDTGNSLKDPISNMPVIVVEYDALGGALPENLKSLFSNAGDNNFDLDNIYSLVNGTDLVLKLRLIPFTSLGKQNGMLLGIKPDMVELNNKNYKKQLKNVIIGIYNNKISKDGEYRALLYPEIFK